MERSYFTILFCKNVLKRVRSKPRLGISSGYEFLGTFAKLCKSFVMCDRLQGTTLFPLDGILLGLISEFFLLNLSEDPSYIKI
jgi:hypothetical protein